MTEELSATRDHNRRTGMKKLGLLFSAAGVADLIGYISANGAYISLFTQYPLPVTEATVGGAVFYQVAKVFLRNSALAPGGRVGSTPRGEFSLISRRDGK